MKHYPYYEEFLVDGIEWPFNVIFTKEHTGDYVIIRGHVNIGEKQFIVSYYMSKKLYQSETIDVCSLSEHKMIEKLRNSIKQWYNSNEGINK